MDDVLSTAILLGRACHRLDAEIPKIDSILKHGRQERVTLVSCSGYDEESEV
jgi:hypothetical protein